MEKLRLDASSNILCEIIVHNSSADKYCKLGVRNIGSINREFILGPKDFASRVVETDRTSTIEAYFEKKSNVKYFLSRILSPKISTNFEFKL
jgi:hypothetical protein